MAIEEKKLDKNFLGTVSGGAIREDKPKEKPKKSWDFRCAKCGYNWKKFTDHPKDEHGCPWCGWWYDSLGHNGDPNHECVFFSDPTK